MRIWKMQVNGPLPKRGGSKPEYLENPPDIQLENRYHILEMKTHRPNRESNPRPVTLVISLLGQNVPALTHWTTDCLIVITTADQWWPSY